MDIFRTGHSEGADGFKLTRARARGEVTAIARSYQVRRPAGTTYASSSSEITQMTPDLRDSDDSESLRRAPPTAGPANTHVYACVCACAAPHARRSRLRVAAQTPRPLLPFLRSSLLALPVRA